MVGGRKTETIMVGEAMLRPSDPSANYAGFRARNLRKSDLAGVIFGCKHSTISECLSKQLFGLPAVHFCYVRNIEPGLPLFLFNYSDRMLHGIYEAAGHGQLNLDPYAWTEDGNERTPFPAQVHICIQTYCQPIPEVQFQSVIMDNYFVLKHFYFELDHKQVKLLKSLFKPTLQGGNIQLQESFGVPKNLPSVFPHDKEAKEQPLTKSWKDAVVSKKETISVGVVSENRCTSVWDNEDDLFVTSGKSSSNDSEIVDDENDNVQENKEPVSDWEDLALNSSLMLPINADLTAERQSQDESNSKPKENDEAKIDRILDKLQKLAVAYNYSSPSSSSAIADVPHASEISTEANTQLPIIPMKMPPSPIFSPAEVEENALMMEELKELRAKVISLEKRQSVSDREVEQLRNKVEDSNKVILQLKEQVKELETKLDPSKALVEGSLDESLVECFLGSEKLIYLIGGYNGRSWLGSLDSYSPSLDILTPLKPMNSPRSYAGATASEDGHLFVFGGVSNSLWYNTAECYNPWNDEWISCPALAREKGCLAGATLNGIIYAIGGGNGENSFSDVEIFDPFLGKWMGSQSMLTKRFATAAAVLNGSIYAVGGFDGVHYLNSAERFDPREVSWNSIPSMKSQRGSHSLVVFNEKLYALGGYDGGQMVSSVEVLDPRVGIWTMGESMNMARGYAAPAVLGDALFILGGIKDSQRFVDAVECYREGAGWEVTGLKAVGTRCFCSAIVL